MTIAEKIRIYGPLATAHCEKCGRTVEVRKMSDIEFCCEEDDD